LWVNRPLNFKFYFQFDNNLRQLHEDSYKPYKFRYLDKNSPYKFEDVQNKYKMNNYYRN